MECKSYKLSKVFTPKHLKMRIFIQISQILQPKIGNYEGL